jgi:UDP-N-acetylglucosamine 2-epimerase (non-hydrolysing)
VVLQGVPVVHLHGGEVTEGAVDERVRHAVSKLADQHCTATAAAAARLRRMGEPPERVHVTGAPGLDGLRGARPLAPEEFTALLGAPLRRPLALCTVHPATATRGPGPGELARTVLEAVTAAAATTVVTHPGQDPGREEVLEVIASFAGAEGVVVRPSLGADYARVLATADVVVGNSSSGVIEAACLGVPAVDVGDRQAGRERAESVVTVAATPQAVRAGLAQALAPGARAAAAHVPSPYGSGPAAGLVVDVVLGAASSPRAKAFSDACTASGADTDAPAAAVAR